MKKGEGEEEGKDIGREGGRREDTLNSVSVVKLAHDHLMNKSIIASRLHMGACYIH